MYWQLAICFLLTCWLVIILERESEDLKLEEDSNWRSIVAVAKINALCNFIKLRYKNKGLYAQQYGRAKRSGGLASKFPVLSDSDIMEEFVQRVPIDPEEFRKQYMNTWQGLPEHIAKVINDSLSDGVFTGREML